MELKGTLTLIQEGWLLFYTNIGKIWKEAQFSFWMSMVGVVAIIGSLGTWAITTLIRSIAHANPSVMMTIFSIVCIVLSLVGFVVAIAFSTSYAIAFTKTLGQLQAQQPINTKDKYRLILPMIGVSILASAAVLGGIILLVIPGIIFWVWYAFSVFARIIDDKKGLSALSYSRSLSKGRFWKVFGRLLLISVIVGFIALLIGLIPQAITGFATSGKGASALLGLVISIPVGIIFSIINVLFGIFMTSVMVVLYSHLKETMPSNTSTISSSSVTN